MRKENHGDDAKVLAVDISLTVVVPCEIMQRLAVNDGDAKFWDELLWDGKGNLKPLSIEAIQFHRIYEDHGLEITAPGREQVLSFNSVRLKKFSAIPIESRKIELSFQAQCCPKQSDVAALSGAFENGSVKVKIIKPKQMDIEEAGKDE